MNKYALVSDIVSSDKENNMRAAYALYTRRAFVHEKESRPIRKLFYCNDFMGHDHIR